MSANQSARLRKDFASLDFLYSPNTLRVLEEAATTFVKHETGTTEIWAASRDWFFEEWGRDTFISLPGLLLSTKRFEEAREVFRHFAAYEKNGLLPNRINVHELLYNTVDASLWFIYALDAYAQATDDWDFVAELLPTMRNIITGYTKGTTYERSSIEYRIYVDNSDGLVVSPKQATWMDADPSGDGSQPITPRAGKCVEVNTLWYSALCFATRAEQQINPDTDVTSLKTQAEQVRQSFQQKFWNEEFGCLYDVIETEAGGGAIRANQIIAVAYGGDLLTRERQQQIVQVVQRDLLTPGGLRTLSPEDPDYIGYYDTSAPMAEKDLAYHQGTIWPWLIGPYCTALQVVDAPLEEIKQAIAPLVQFCLDSEYKSLPEVFSGDYPMEPGGTTSQAWSIAEILRNLKSLG